MPITILAPRQLRVTSPEEYFGEEYFRRNPLDPYSETTQQFCAAVSKAVFDSNESRRYPELMAVAYWLRPSNLNALLQTYAHTSPATGIPAPRGFVFHIAPSNVDSIFVYSWVLSMLAGNLNVVRVSSAQSDQLGFLLDIFRKVMSDGAWESIAARNAIITYEHDDATSTFFSSRSDVRVIWGGDETVRSIRALPSKPTTKDVAFADKISLSAINAAAYALLADAEAKSLAHKFFNDAYWFDQMACSSPRVVYFVGDEKSRAEASKKFWEFNDGELRNNQHEDALPVAMNKLVTLHEKAAEGVEYLELRRLSWTDSTVLRTSPGDVQRCRDVCGGGIFVECHLDSLAQLGPLIRENDQTLSYFGFEKEDLTAFLRSLRGKGIARCVPIGMALNFEPVWDGFELFKEFTKTVTCI